MSVEEVHALLARAEELPYGEARTVLVEDALRRAEATGDPVLAYRVRMELTGSYQHGGEPAKAFATFSRCLSQHDSDPGRFGGEQVLLWQFKWIVNSLTLFPEIPLDRTYAVLDDMERRYRLGGHSLQAVYHYRHVVARHVGDEEAAEEWFAKWHAAPRDALSDCEGCDPTGKVRHLIARGRHEEALQVAAPVLGRELNCTEQPQNILTALLPAYLATGRLEEAARAHRRAYRLTRANLRDMADIADHMEFCARTGNHARGLEILQRHLEWLERAPSPYARMRFAAAAALVLRMADTGEGLTLRGPSGEPVAAAELHRELTAQALELAGRFDARNGSSCQGDRVRAVLEAEPILEWLPLSPYARRPAPPPPPAAGPAAAADGPDELLQAAEDAWTRGDVPAALAAWRRFDELVTEPTAAQAGRRADGTGLERMTAGDMAGAADCWQRAAELHLRAGDETRAQSTRGRVGAAWCALGRVDEGLDLLTASLARLEEIAAGTRWADAARLRLAGALLQLGRAAEALEVLDSGDLTDPMEAAEGQVLRGRVLLDLDRADEAEQALRRGYAALRESDGVTWSGEVAFLLAQLVMHRRPEPPAEGPDEVLALLDEAIARLPVQQSPLRASAHAVRGGRLMACGRFADAADDLIEAVAAFTAAGIAPQAAYARLDLAAALLQAGRHFEAAEVAEEAGPMLAQLADHDAERRCRYLLAQAQEELGEAGAADIYAELAAEEREERPHAAARLLEKAADALSRLDRSALAAERYAAAAEAFTAAGDPYGVVRARRCRAMCLAWSGRPEEGLQAMAEARAALDDLPAGDPAARTWETAAVCYDHAHLLAGVGRLAEALEQVEQAIAGFAELGERQAADTAAAFRERLLAAAGEE